MLCKITEAAPEQPNRQVGDSSLAALLLNATQEGVAGYAVYGLGLMARYTLQSSAFRTNTRPVIWLDVEKRTADTEPALTSVQFSDGLTTYVHEPILAQSAKARKLEFQPWTHLATDIVRTARATNSLIGGYSILERDQLMAACSEHAEWIKDNYLNANAAKWFRNNRPELHTEACRTAVKPGKPGLKDFLIQPAVGYGYKKYLLKVKPGLILKRLRDLLTKRDGGHRELTKEAKRDWTHLIEYNRQDVLGMIHLVEFVRREGATRRPPPPRPLTANSADTAASPRSTGRSRRPSAGTWSAPPDAAAPGTSRR